MDRTKEIGPWNSDTRNQYLREKQIRLKYQTSDDVARRTAEKIHHNAGLAHYMSSRLYAMI